MQILFEDYVPTPILRGHLNLGGVGLTGERIDVNSRYIERGGRPWIGVMGEYHFCRDSRAHWHEELAKMKAGGIGIVATYVIWIYHEEIEGEFDFDGDLDLRAFLSACKAQGMDVLLRIGPWTHGECRNGGFPDWLLGKGFPLRKSNPGYMRYVRTWYQRIFEQAQGMLFKDGGPVIGIQLENELIDDAQHLLDLKHLAQQIGFDVPLYTVTGWNSLYGARIPLGDVLPVFGAYAEAPWAQDLSPQPLSPHYAFDPARNDTAIGKDLMQACDTDGWRLPYERYPYAMCELGCGLQSTYHRRINLSGMDAYAMALVKLGCGNNLVGYYMYHGGTNRIGKRSTLQESRETGYPNDVPILNYDFHTCLGQYGQAREQYDLLNMLHLFLEDFGEQLAPMEHVPAQRFVPCTNLEDLRCCLRTDGRSAYVFINHYQRMARLRDVHGVRLRALDVDLPPLDVVGDVAFILPVHVDLAGVQLRYATAQLLCTCGRSVFFAQIEGIAPRYAFDMPDGEVKTVCAEAGPGSAFTVGDLRIVTLKPQQARALRRLDGQVVVGEGCRLYSCDGEIRAIEEGSFTYHRWTGEGFERIRVERVFTHAVLEMEPTREPFVPRYACELHLGGGDARRWWRLRVSGPQGLVRITGEYDVAQIYAGEELIADNFFCGEAWQVPASLLYGRTCHLVCSPPSGHCYLEYLQPKREAADDEGGREA